jgi:hypothetical protein
MYKNGCKFSESRLPETKLKNYVACADYIDEKDFERKLSQIEKATGIGK